MSRAALVVLAALGGGCMVARDAALHSPQQRRYDRVAEEERAFRTPDAWREWTTAHLTFVTDLNVAAALELLTECERSLAAFDALLLPMAPRPRDRLRVIAFARASDYVEVGRPHSFGYFRANDVDGEPQPTIYIAADRNVGATLVEFQHELTHRYLDGIPHVPVWLEEGMAGYLSSLRVGADEVRLGAPPPYVDRRDLDRLLAGDYQSFHRVVDESRNYRLAAALVAFLWFELPKELDGYLRGLAEGMAPAAAWQRYFPRPLQDPFELWYREALQVARGGRFNVQRFDWRGAPASGASPPRYLSTGEVLRFCAVSRARDDGLAGIASFEWLMGAVALDPFDATSRYIAGIWALAPDVGRAGDELLEQAATLAPDDVRIAAALANARLMERTSDERLVDIEPLMARIWRKTTLVNPLMTLAAWEHARGHDAEALRFARRAVDVSPRCARCRREYAGLLNVVGRQDELRRTLDALAALYPQATREEIERLHADFAKVQAAISRCRDGAGAACETMGDAYVAGMGAPRDFARGTWLRMRACEHGVPTACAATASSVRRGFANPRDPARAAVLGERACAGEVWNACNNLGDQYELGEGVPRDLARAKALYERACAHDEGWFGCVSLAGMAWRGNGMAHDEARVAEWLRTAARHMRTLAQMMAGRCATEADMCAMAAVAYARGITIEVDQRRAQQFMARACAMGDAAACRWR